MIAPYFDEDGITLYHGDCRDVLPAIGSVDHVITDPPYSEHVHTKSRAGTRVLSATGHVADFNRAVDFGFASLTDDVRDAAAAMCAALVRRWVLVFSDVESATAWRVALVAAGLQYCRTGAWVKINGTPQFTGDRPGVGFEAITICHPKGRKRWNGGGRHALWSVPIVLNRHGRTRRFHTTQKPEALLLALITEFTDPGDVILDPFAGSGTTLVAAKRLGRKAIGIEIDETYCATTVDRLRQGALFAC